MAEQVARANRRLLMSPAIRDVLWVRLWGDPPEAWVRVKFLQRERRQEIELLHWPQKGETHMNETFDQTWRALSEEILADVNQWRAAHPQATFQELEQALYERFSRLQAQSLQEAALARTASDWSQSPERGPSPLPYL